MYSHNDEGELMCYHGFSEVMTGALTHILDKARAPSNVSWDASTHTRNSRLLQIETLLERMQCLTWKPDEGYTLQESARAIRCMHPSSGCRGLPYGVLHTGVREVTLAALAIQNLFARLCLVPKCVLSRLAYHQLKPKKSAS
jgi:hypothetical protein